MVALVTDEFGKLLLKSSLGTCLGCVCHPRQYARVGHLLLQSADFNCSSAQIKWRD